MTEPNPIRLVQNAGALKQVVDQLQDCDGLAIDTEFHAERRHEPELMLIQVNNLRGSTWIIDPLAIDIAPLGPLIGNHHVVLHSGAQDLAILWRETQQRPPSVFDVQLAAGLVGMRHPMRLNDLVVHLLEVPMDKGETLSDWSTRPLSNQQVAYAVGDVKVLGPLAEQLHARLDALNRTHWLREECEALIERSCRPSETAHTWVHWDIAPRLDPHVQRTLGCLFEWRNQKGRDKGQPASFMLSDGLALDIARRQPQNLAELAANRRIPQGLIRRLGAEIVAVVRHVQDHDIELPRVPSPTDFRRAQAIQLWAEAWGEAHNVAPSLVMSAPLANELAREGTSALYGWRAEAFAEDIESYLTGRVHLGINESGVCLVDSAL